MEQLQLGVDGWTFDALAAGPPTGRPVLLLHGFPQDAREWAVQQAALAEAGYRAVAVDQRGYSPGARPAGDADYGAARLASDVVGLARALGGERLDLVGHDWGAVVGWHVAGRHPELLRSLTAVSVPHPLALTEALASDPDQQEKSRYIGWLRDTDDVEAALLADDAARLRGFFVGAQHVDVAAYVEAFAADPGRLTAAVRWYRGISRRDLVGLGPVVAPTLHVWGNQDPALGRSGTEGTAQHVDGPYRLVELDTGHWVPEDAAQQLTDALLEHLAAT